MQQYEGLEQLTASILSEFRCLCSTSWPGHYLQAEDRSVWVVATTTLLRNQMQRNSQEQSAAAYPAHTSTLIADMHSDDLSGVPSRLLSPLRTLRRGSLTRST